LGYCYSSPQCSSQDKDLIMALTAVESKPLNDVQRAWVKKMAEILSVDISDAAAQDFEKVTLQTSSAVAGTDGNAALDAISISSIGTRSATASTHEMQSSPREAGKKPKTPAPPIPAPPPPATDQEKYNDKLSNAQERIRYLKSHRQTKLITTEIGKAEGHVTKAKGFAKKFQYTTLRELDSVVTVYEAAWEFVERTAKAMESELSLREDCNNFKLHQGIERVCAEQIKKFDEKFKELGPLIKAKKFDDFYDRTASISLSTPREGELMPHRRVPLAAILFRLVFGVAAFGPWMIWPADSEAGAQKTGGTSAVKENRPMPDKSTTRRAPTHEMIFLKESYGTLPDGREVTLYTCQNAFGMTLKMIDYGATVVALEYWDRERKRENITLGFDRLEGYLQCSSYIGATVGRYCNRICGGKFTLDGNAHTLFTNEGSHHLHGGKNGLSRALWTAERIKTGDSVGVNFIYESPDGDEGYPGKLRVVAGYELNNKNELMVILTATTDKPTPVNLTNHCYWNLSGTGEGTILDHELTIDADKVVAVDESLIPTGQLADVAGTPLDFREPHKIGARIRQLKTSPQGYDHCYVLNPDEEKIRFAASAYDPKSGRVMEIYTSQPGLQFYSGNFLDGSAANGRYQRYAGLCLETQHFPDSPNHANFPNTILRPGETYRQVTIHKFRVESRAQR
jgi:aldose 1-epimerase